METFIYYLFFTYSKIVSGENMNLLKKIGILALFLLSIGMAIAYEDCHNNDVWEFDDNLGCPVSMVEDCGENETMGTVCLDNSVFEIFTHRGCDWGSCFAVEQMRLSEVCQADGCYDNEYRDYECDDGQCVYTVIKEGDSDKDGIDDKCDDCIDKNKNGICAGEDDCDDCMGGDADSPFLDIMDCEVKIDGRYVEPDRTIYKVFERGEEIDITLEIVAFEDSEDVQIEAMILGYEHGDKERELITDLTGTFDIKANRSYFKELTLTIPEDIETGDLKVRIIVSDRTHTTWVRDYNLDVYAQKHRVVIKDIMLEPNEEIKGGRTLIAQLRVKNLGMYDEEDLKVVLEIPDLDIKITDYIDEIEIDDSESSDDIFFRIPDCPKEGNYTIRATVYYDDDYEETTEETSIIIIRPDSCGASSGDDDNDDDFDDISDSKFDEKTMVKVTGSKNSITSSEGAVYPIMISNFGLASKTYVITVKGVQSWGTYRLDPSSVIVIDAGETEVPYLFISASNNAQPGDKVFTVEVSSGKESKEITLIANVAPTSNDNSGNSVTGGVAGITNFTGGLEIAVLALVILLVFIGIVMGASKLRE